MEVVLAGEELRDLLWHELLETKHAALPRLSDPFFREPPGQGPLQAFSVSEAFQELLSLPR